MNANDTLITPQECVEYAPVDGNSYGEQRVNFIVDKEEQLFRRCFGFDFYKILLEDKIRYCLESTGSVTNPATKYSNFNENVVYTEGVYVLYKGVIYKVKKTTTGKQVPPNQSYFDESQKFATPAYDFLWKRYLRRILAFCINNDSMFFRVVRDTPKGVGQVNDDSFTPISTKSAATMRNEWLKIIDDAIENCRLYILDNPADFKDCTWVKNECKNECATRKIRHHGFNTNRY
jgi:hypothetical protein